MKFFEFLKFGRKQKPLPPIKTVRSPSQASAGRKPAVDRRNPPVVCRRREPTIEKMLDEAGDLELSQDPADVIDNPYETHSWRLDQGTGARRVNDLSSINRDRAQEKSKQDPDNPYDQSTVRKGW